MDARIFLLLLAGVVLGTAPATGQRPEVPPLPAMPGPPAASDALIIEQGVLWTGAGLSALHVQNASGAEVELVIALQDRVQTLGRLRPGADSTFTHLPSRASFTVEARAVGAGGVVDRHTFWLVPIETATWRVERQEMVAQPKAKRFSLFQPAAASVRRGSSGSVGTSA